MAIVPRELKSGKTTYYVTFTWGGRTVWERSGSSRREAESLESERKKQVELGSYRPGLPRGSRVTVASWLAYFFTTRSNRSLENDISLIENHVMPHEQFSQMRLSSVEPGDMLRLVEHLNSVPSIGAKTVSIIYGIVRQALERAAFERVIDSNPCKLPKGTVRWKSRRKRRPYTREEVQRLTRDARIPWDQRMFNALAFYTGMREGEICGRRWRDWKRDWEPLTCLSVENQYDGQPLKTDDLEEIHPRQVPVHPELESMLRGWLANGFEVTHLRKPTLDDFIVPHRKIGNHTKSSAYKAFQRSLAKVGVENRTLHSTRHTFISIARSNGAQKDVIERVTHNATGDVVDDYTTFEWLALCKAVAFFDVSVDRNSLSASMKLQSLDSNRGEYDRNGWKPPELAGNGGSKSSGKSREMPLGSAVFDAHQPGPRGCDSPAPPAGANGPDGRAA